MHSLKPYLALAALCLLAWGGFSTDAFAQAEVMAWGNLHGIRVEGHLMAFETSLCLVGADASVVDRTAKETRRTEYVRDGSRQTISAELDHLAFTETVEDTGSGTATVAVQFTAAPDTIVADTSLAGGYFCIDLPGEDFMGGTVELIDPASGAEEVSLASADTAGAYVRTAGGVRFVAPNREVEVQFATPAKVVVRGDAGSDAIQAFIEVMPVDPQDGQTAQNTFTLTATGEIDRRPVALVLDATKPGRAFDGIGGNFRLQNPRTDPPVIDYNLDNLRVAWSRVEMPWQHWHPEEAIDPIAEAEAGHLHPRVQAAMEMAQRLARMDVPVIVSTWFAPAWAVIEEDEATKRAKGLRGDALDPLKMDKIYASIADYLVYLKNHYGVEAALFSFNESDLGIDVRQTAEEHRDLIKDLGAYLGERGLATKLLLGDVSDATATDFIVPTMEDPEALVHVGAVSFHSWRGWSDELLTYWGDAAKKLNVPLLVGEGSTDAAAWRYPEIFEEASFALQEIELYTRILALAEPLSILQWQLTSDYSLLVGNGIFGTDGPLRPLQRFWNLKQLAATPEDAFSLPITCDRPHVTCVAFGNIAEGAYAVHIVNTGAERPATLTGLPEGLTELRVYVTDSEHGMEEGEPIPVSNGTAQLTLDATSFTTLMSEL